MTAKLTQFESEAIRGGWLPPSAVAKVGPATRRYFGVDETPGAGNDTQDTRDNPRAAGAASDRGAQPSPRQVCDCRTVNDQGGEPRFWPCPVHG